MRMVMISKISGDNLLIGDGSTISEFKIKDDVMIRSQIEEAICSMLQTSVKFESNELWGDSFVTKLEVIEAIPCHVLPR